MLKKNRKPIITLLVIVLGSSFVVILYLSMYIPGKLLIDNSTYFKAVENIISTNIYYIVVGFHPFVYGLYFKQTREPMMKRMKGCMQNEFHLP